MFTEVEIRVRIVQEPKIFETFGNLRFSRFFYVKAEKDWRVIRNDFIGVLGEPEKILVSFEYFWFLYNPYSKVEKTAMCRAYRIRGDLTSDTSNWAKATESGGARLIKTKATESGGARIK